jgi:hypothetical protein
LSTVSFLFVRYAWVSQKASSWSWPNKLSVIRTVFSWTQKYLRSQNMIHINVHGLRIAMVQIVSVAIIICSAPYCLAISTSGYVDQSFTCPATTICPQVCAPTIEECPTHCQNNETLCSNGSCIPDGVNCPVIVDLPCQSPCASITCPAVIATLPSCLEDFAVFYNRVASCPAPNDSGNTMVEQLKQDLLWTSGVNVLVYCWALLGTVAIIGWSWYKCV